MQQNANLTQNTRLNVELLTAEHQSAADGIDFEWEQFEGPPNLDWAANRIMKMEFVLFYIKT